MESIVTFCGGVNAPGPLKVAYSLRHLVFGDMEVRLLQVGDHFALRIQCDAIQHNERDGAMKCVCRHGGGLRKRGWSNGNLLGMKDGRRKNEDEEKCECKRTAHWWSHGFSAL